MYFSEGKLITTVSTKAVYGICTDPHNEHRFASYVENQVSWRYWMKVLPLEHGVYFIPYSFSSSFSFLLLLHHHVLQIYWYDVYKRCYFWRCIDYEGYSLVLLGYSPYFYITHSRMCSLSLSLVNSPSKPQCMIKAGRKGVTSSTPTDWGWEKSGFNAIIPLGLSLNGDDTTLR